MLSAWLDQTIHTLFVEVVVVAGGVGKGGVALVVNPPQLNSLGFGVVE